jgi:hypothetical protein
MKYLLPEISSDITGGIRQFCENLRSLLQEITSTGINKKLSVYANNAAAIAGGLKPGDFYRTNGDPDPVCIVH